MKHQLGLMLVLIGLTFTTSPTEAALDEKSEILGEWLVDPEIERLTVSQRVTRRRGGTLLLRPGTLRHSEEHVDDGDDSDEHRRVFHVREGHVGDHLPRRTSRFRP